MKKILTVAVLALVMISCGSDDDNASQADASIIGTFVLTNFNSPFNDDYNNDGTTSTNLLVEVPCFMNTVTFNDNGSYASTATSLILNLDNDGNTSADCEGPFDETGTYTLNEDVVTITQETTTDPDGDVALSWDSGTTQITNAGLTVTVETPFGTAIFQYDRQ